METISDGIIKVKTFNDDYFNNVKKIIMDMIKYKNIIWEESKVFDHEKGIEVINTNERQCKQYIIRGLNDIFKVIRKKLLLSFEFPQKISDIILDNTITLIKYEKGDFFNTHRDFIHFKSKNCYCYHLVLYLNNTSKGGNTNIHIKPNTIFSTKNDVLFDKTLNHSSDIITDGEKNIALINVVIKYNSNNDETIFKLPYLSENNHINFYEDEGNRKFCYCLVTVNNYSTEVDTFGLILNRSGKCVLVNKYDDIITEKLIFENFDDMCMEISFSYNDIIFDYLKNEDGKNIAWKALNSSCDEIWYPKSKNDFDFLKDLVKYVNNNLKDKINYYVLTGNCNSEIHYINFNVVRCYFSI